MAIPEFKSRTHEQFRTINVNGIFGGIRMGYLEAIVYSEESDLTKVLKSPQLDANKVEIERVLHCRLIFDPLQLKSTAIWLNKKVEEYEKTFGTIPSPEEISEKQKRSKDQ